MSRSTPGPSNARSPRPTGAVTDDRPETEDPWAPDNADVRQTGFPYWRIPVAIALVKNMDRPP